MGKKNWFDGINNRLPAKEYDFELPELGDFGNFANGLLGHVKDYDNFMKSFNDFGFQDKDDHYEMVTELGGNGNVKEDAVKVELADEKDAYLGVSTVKISYEHNGGTEHGTYSHTQKTQVSLPADADKETLRAYFDDNNNVVITVKKKVKEEPKRGIRNIPIRGRE